MAAQQGLLKICDKGHKYYKSSDCPVCPVCEKEKRIPIKRAAEKFTGIINQQI